MPLKTAPCLSVFLQPRGLGASGTQRVAEGSGRGTPAGRRLGNGVGPPLSQRRGHGGLRGGEGGAGPPAAAAQRLVVGVQQLGTVTIHYSN